MECSITDESGIQCQFKASFLLARVMKTDLGNPYLEKLFSLPKHVHDIWGTFKATDVNGI
jgi:hypothetical protein